MARLLLGVCGGVAAYKSVELARLAAKAGHAVRVIQTPASLNFVGKATFEGITGAPVLVSEFERDPMGGAYPGEPRPDHDPIGHLELVRRCDVFCIAPATANTLAKLATGQADNMLTAAYLASAGPVLVAPAMNNRMYEHPATETNLAALKDRGVHVVDASTGALASKGEWGIGRMAEPADLLVAMEQLAPLGGPRSLDGTRVLVTTGGTREPLDAVRYIGNRSSGRMGFALANAAQRRGADVAVICANVSLPRSAGIRYLDVETAEQMRDATLAELDGADILLMAAAVADYRPEHPVAGKISKTESESLPLQLVRTADVIAEAARRRRPDQVLVGFAAEHGAQGRERARSKLVEKGLNAIIFNDISDPHIGFESDENEVTIIGPQSEQSIDRAPKETVAELLLDFVERMRSEGRGVKGERR